MEGEDMHCPNCGSKVPDGASFCTNCGSAIEPVAQQPVPEAAPAPEPTPAPAPEPTPAPEPVPKTAQSESAPPPPPTPDQAPTPTPEPKKDNKNTKIIAIVLIVVGVVALVFGIIRITRAVGNIMGNQSDRQNSSQVVNSSSSSSGSSSSSSEKKVSAKDYTDSKGHITLNALCELDGKHLHEVMSEIDYDQITDGGETMFTNDPKGYALLIHAGADDKCIGFDNIDSIAVGGANDPIYYEVGCAGYKDIEDFVKTMGPATLSKLRSSADKSIYYGIAENSQGYKYFVYLFYNNNKAVIAKLYGEDAIKAGVVSDYGSTVDAVYKKVDKEMSGDSTSSSSSNKKDLGGATEVELK